MVTPAAIGERTQWWVRSLQKRTGETPARTDTWGVVLAGSHIWAGTEGQRLISGPLAPLLGQSLITHVIEWLRGNGVPGVTVCANSNTTALCRLLGDGAADVADIDYYKDVMPRGPAGCVRDASVRHAGLSLVVAEATVWPEFNLGPLLDFHDRTRSSLTIVVNDPACFGNGRNGLLQPAGLYVFSPSALQYVPKTGYVDIKEALVPRLRAAGERVMAYVAPGEHLPRLLGTSAYWHMCAWAVEKAAARDPLPDEHLRCGNALVHRSATIASTARLLGPIWVGPKCVIEDQVILAGPCAVDAGSVIETGAVVNRSFVWKACRVGAKAVVNDCVLLGGTRVAPDCLVEARLLEPRGPHGGRWASRWVRGFRENGKGRGLLHKAPWSPPSHLQRKTITAEANQTRVNKPQQSWEEAAKARC